MESNQQPEKQKYKNVIIGVTGSVATIKLNELIEKIIDKLKFVNICVVPTKSSLHFINDIHGEKYNNTWTQLSDKLKFLKKPPENQTQPVVMSFVDEDEWASWSKRTDPVLHIELRKWADLIVIAPLDANTMAKVSTGLCDNLLTCVLRAWDLENIKSKPVVICPAMNTFMYNHPLTKQQLDLLVNQWGFVLVGAIEKALICGDVGMGAMAKVDDIVNKVASSLDSAHSS